MDSQESMHRNNADWPLHPRDDAGPDMFDEAALANAARAGAAPADGSDPAYRGSRFADVWRTVCSDAYETLPEKRLGLTSIPELLSKGIYAAARRTLTSRADLLPPFDKLVHCVGICLRGTWSIDADTPYTGLFATGSSGLLIARASDAVGEHRPGKLRFMGLAGKLYATGDPEHETPLRTANFFTLENLSGTHTKHFLDAILPTDLWRPRPRAEAAAEVPVGAVVGAAFALADRALSPAQAMFRQLDPIAALEESQHHSAVSPVVMRLVPSAGNRSVDASDLREELRMVHHPEGIRHHIEVADRRGNANAFRRIGSIHFTKSVASYAGDHRLHFAHPPYRHSWWR